MPSVGTENNKKRGNEVDLIKLATRIADGPMALLSLSDTGISPVVNLLQNEGLLVVTSAGGCGHAYSSNISLVAV